MNHIVKGRWREEMIFDLDQPGGTLTVDAGVEMGGADAGFRSKPLMLSAIAGCTGMDVASMIKKMRLEVDAFKIEVDAAMREEHPKIYTHVSIVYFFNGSRLNKEKLRRAVKLSSENYCGVIAMFRAFAEVEIKIMFNNELDL